MTGTGARSARDEDRAGLWAHVGDRLIIGGATIDDAGRDGEIVGLHHADGTPPYDVRWSDTGRVSLVFPGPDARVHHFADSGAEAAAPRR
ncbi:DUF1918 domain-containing protein [Streptomyces roseoviridis]|uniref:DUF1918 domain-containing protein n=1 Tax=Streptomyces roseoviridis TaxID=67361 RepID=A0ABV5QUF2_9ACTN